MRRVGHPTDSNGEAQVSMREGALGAKTQQDFVAVVVSECLCLGLLFSRRRRDGHSPIPHQHLLAFYPS